MDCVEGRIFWDQRLPGMNRDERAGIFDAMNRTAEQIAGVLRRTEGATDVKVEQTSGLPMLDIRPNRDAMARLGVTAQDVQDVVTATIGGRPSG
ncbi:efflux RND transporter permease subunit, partial [Escherichia coli]|uniref:efflux RND transporter permease subunit n=1 Tax=Escherichia coli TaxID=562 RepID=UPI00200C24DF